MRGKDRSTKGCGGCLVLMSLPFMFSGAGNIMEALGKTPIDYSSIFGALFAISLFLIPGLMLRRRADSNYANYLNTVANVMRTHKEISAQELAFKIGIPVYEAEIIIGEISAADNGIFLRYNPSNQTYSLIQEGIEESPSTPSGGPKLPEWLVVLKTKNISPNRRRRLSTFLHLNDRELAKCIILGKPIPVGGAKSELEAQELALKLGVCAVNVEVVQREQPFPVRWASNTSAWFISFINSAYKTRNARWQSQWERIQVPEFINSKMGLGRKAIRYARFAILTADLSEVVIRDMLEPLDELDEALDRQIESHQVMREEELDQLIDSAETMAKAVAGAQRHIVASEEIKKKAQVLQSHISQIKKNT